VLPCGPVDRVDGLLDHRLRYRLDRLLSDLFGDSPSRRLNRLTDGGPGGCALRHGVRDGGGERARVRTLLRFRASAHQEPQGQQATEDQHHL
jgi:hypothetical protein